MTDASYLTGKCLLAMPTLADPRFHKSVILMCVHNKDGAMGLVINKPLTTMNFDDLMEQLPFEGDDEVTLRKLNLPLLSGGPVESARGFLLHDSTFENKESTHVGDDYGVTGTLDTLKDAAYFAAKQKSQKKSYGNMAFVLGHAAWTAGQLEREIQDNAWLTADCGSSIIFHDKSDEIWTMATRSIGIDPVLLSVQSGRA